MAHGLDLPIINPNSTAVMQAIRVFRVLYNQDKNAQDYIEACAHMPQVQTSQAPVAQVVSGEEELPPLIRAVAKGLKDDARRLTEQMLEQGESELNIVNTWLIPALDLVGERFERGEIFCRS